VARPEALPPGDPARVAVALSDVRFERSGRAEPVLDGASLTIQPGEKVVLIGPNGAGKSTILSLLLGFAEPARGSVTVGGVDLRDLDGEAWRRWISYLPERPTLLAGSLAANLRLADPSAGDARLVEVLRRVGGAGLLEALAGGLDARVGEGGRRLSAGERQRIALARALLRPASLHLLDEPTAHLDDRTEATVLEALSGALAGCSALIVTHRPAVIDLADRVITLDAGRFWAATAHRMGAGAGAGVGAGVGAAGGAPATLPLTERPA
jgi:ATP-binding cassette subfamily C protein CydCD